METIMTSFCDGFLVVWFKQGGKFSWGIPSHRPSFPVIKIAVALRNIPSCGTPPWNLLNDRFNEESPGRLPRISGIIPDKLLLERSSTRRPLRFPSDGGIVPCWRFPDVLRYSKLRHSPMEAGISPEILLLEKSSWLRFLRSPTSDGRVQIGNFVLD